MAFDNNQSRSKRQTTKKMYHGFRGPRNPEQSKQLVQVHACKLELQNVITEITRLGLELSTSEEPGPGP